MDKGSSEVCGDQSALGDVCRKDTVSLPKLITLLSSLLFPAERISIQSLMHSHKKSMGYRVCIHFSERSISLMKAANGINFI